MEINIQVLATIGECGGFIDEVGNRGQVSIVISPLKVVNENEKVQIVSGCNLWKSCHNTSCWYSIAARELGMPVQKKKGSEAGGVRNAAL